MDTEYQFWAATADGRKRYKEKVRAIDAPTAIKRWCAAQDFDMPASGLEAVKMLDKGSYHAVVNMRKSIDSAFLDFSIHAVNVRASSVCVCALSSESLFTPLREIK